MGEWRLVLILCAVFAVLFVQHKITVSMHSDSKKELEEAITLCPTEIREEIIKARTDNDCENATDRFLTKPRVAILVPLYRPDIEKVITGIKKWAEESSSPACNNEKNYGTHRDLILYVNEFLDPEKDQKVQELLREIEGSGVMGCFGTVKFLYASLPNELNTGSGRNLAGINSMFWQLFDKPELVDNYEYFMQMEHDVLPIRPMWLDIIYEECYFTLENFWVKGSIYRGSDDLIFGGCYTFHGCAEHINGNAIYNLEDPIWLKFIRDVAAAHREHSLRDWAFDQIWMHYLKLPENFKFWCRWAPKFVYTEFIQNYQRINVGDVQQIYSNTYLLHKPGGVKAIDVLESISNPSYEWHPE